MPSIFRQDHRLRSRLRLALCLYFLACIGLLVIRTVHWKQVNDPAQIHYIDFLMDHGMVLYRDILELNMPGIFLVNWIVMHTLGAGSLAWRIFDFSLMAAIAWAMIEIARPYDWMAGLFGATLFILYHGRDGAGQQGQRDLLMAVLLVCAYAFLFQAFRKDKAWPMLAFGLCSGMASTIKPTPLLFALLLLLLAALRWRRTGRPLLRPLLYASLGLLFPFVLEFAWLASHHAVGAFLYVLRVILPYYAHLGRVSFPDLLDDSSTASVQTIAGIALAIALLKRDWWNWEGKLLALGVLFGFASFAAQGRGFAYHRYPMLAFLFLWAGIQIASGLRGRTIVRALATLGIIFGVVVAPLYVARASRKVWDPSFIDSLTGDLTRLGGSQLSGHVQCIYMPADCDTTLYRMRLMQSTGLIYDYFVFGPANQPVIEDSRSRFWHQFQQNPPWVIVVGSGLYPKQFGYGKLASWPLFDRLLMSGYVFYDQHSFAPGEAGPMGYRIYVRKNSAGQANAPLSAVAGEDKRQADR